MRLNFLFMDESYNKATSPHISSMTGLLIPLDRYPALRSAFYEILRLKTEPNEGVLDVSVPELRFADFLREEDDEVKLEVLRSLANMIVGYQVEIFRVGYYITKRIRRTFERDKHLIGLCWLGILSSLQPRLESEMVIPIMDAGFDRNMKQMTKQFSGLMKTVDVMRETGRGESIGFAHSKNVLDVFYAGSEYSIFTQLADIVSGLRRIAETARQDQRLISSPFKKQLLPISNHLMNAPMHEEILTLRLGSGSSDQ